MANEISDLSKTLVWTVEMITQAGPDELERVASAYCEAQDLVSQIPKTVEGARPRIVACFHRSDEYRAVEDIACVGWILTAIEERVNGGDLPDWRKLRKFVKNAVKLLLEPAHRFTDRNQSPAHIGSQINEQIFTVMKFSGRGDAMFGGSAADWWKPTFGALTAC